MKGIDVSKYQKLINWDKVDASGIDFALIRAGMGNVISQKDKFFDTNVQNALAQGLHVGVYYFSYAVSVADAQKEADICNEIIKPYKGKLDFPIAFDYEYDSINYFKRVIGRTPTNVEIDSFAVAFLERLKSYGWFVNIYTNNDFIRSGRFSRDTISKYDVWLADYSGGPDFPCGIQQTGSTGRVPGINGNVDMDIAYKEYPTIIKAGGYNGYPKSQDFTCDTTCDIKLKRGQAYQLKVTSNTPPKVTVGTPNVVTLLPRYSTGNNYFYYLVGVGNPKDGAGIFVNGQKQFVAHIK